MSRNGHYNTAVCWPSAPSQTALFCQCWETSFWSETTSLLPHTTSHTGLPQQHSIHTMRWMSLSPDLNQVGLGCLPGLSKPPGRWHLLNCLVHSTPQMFTRQFILQARATCSPSQANSELPSPLQASHLCQAVLQDLASLPARPTLSCLVHSKPHIFARQSFRIWLASQPGQLRAAWSTPSLTSLPGSPSGSG